MRSAHRWTHNMRSAEREVIKKSESRESDNGSSHGKEKKENKEKREKDARKKTQQYTNELCEILSSDDSNQHIEQDTDNFIIVELISYIAGNSRIMTYYPSTRGSKSGQNKYLHHFYSKKRIKLYLCLHKRSNEIYIYKVESRKVKRRDTHPGNGACSPPVPDSISFHGENMRKENAFMHSGKVKSEQQYHAPPPPNEEHNPIINEFTSSCKEEPTHDDCKRDKYKIKVEDKAIPVCTENPDLREKCTKKMVVTKLFDSVHCSYDLSTIEFTKLNNPDDKTLNSLKSILEQKINKGETRISDAGYSREGGTTKMDTSKGTLPSKGDTQLDTSNLNTLSKGIPPSDHSCAKTEEAGKNMTRSGDNDNACDSQIKILFLLFREPADIYMNQFAAFDQGNDETCMKEINGFLKDEQQQHLERECTKAKRTNKYGSQIKQITHDQVPQNFLQSYESDVSIYSNDVYFSDTQVVTRENELDMNEKKKKKKSIPVFTRSHLKIKWLLLNLNLTKDEEVLIQKYVLLKKNTIMRSTKSTHDSNDLHSSFYKTKKRSNWEKGKFPREQSHLLKGDTTCNGGKPYSTRSTRKGNNTQVSQQNKNNTEKSSSNEPHHAHLSMNDRDDNNHNENTVKDKLTERSNKSMFMIKLEDDEVKTRRQAGDVHHEHVTVEDKMSCQVGEINVGNQNDDSAEVDRTVREADAPVEAVSYYHVAAHSTADDAQSEFVPSNSISKGKNYLHDDPTTSQEQSCASKICSSYSYLDHSSQVLYDQATDHKEEETQNVRKRKIEQIENTNEMKNRGKKNLHALSERERYHDTFPEIRNTQCEIVTSEVEAAIGSCQVIDVISTSNGPSNGPSNSAPNEASNDTSNDSLAVGSGKNHSGNSHASYISETDSRYRRCADSVEEVLPTGEGQGQQMQRDGVVGSSGDSLSGNSDREGCIQGDVSRADQEEVNEGSDHSAVSGDHLPPCHAEKANETTQNSTRNDADSEQGDQEALFFKYKVRSVFDIIKVICCHFMRHFKYTTKLKFYITTFLNFSKIEKTKLQFMHKERIVDTQLLKMYINKKTEDVNNAWKINTYKMDPHNLFRLGKFKYIDDSIIDFFHNYIHSFVLTKDKRKKNDIYIFNTFFYKKIELYEDSCKAYMNTNRWIQKLDRKVYEYTYVFVPINISNTHWSLVLLYFPFNDNQGGGQHHEEVAAQEEVAEGEEENNAQEASTPSAEDSPDRSTPSEENSLNRSTPSAEDSPKRSTPSGEDPTSSSSPSHSSQPSAEDSSPDHLRASFRSKSCESYFSKEAGGALSESNTSKNHTSLLNNYLQGQGNVNHYHEKKEGHSCKNVKSASDCGDHHTEEIPANEHMTSLLTDTNKTGSTRTTCNETSTKVDDQQKNENVKIAYMIYLDSLFPSIRGNKILHKLKKYLEYMLQRDYASPAGAAPTATYNATSNATTTPRIFFKFVYPNVIPKQTNTYDCGIYIIQFVLHLCLNKHLVESELIKSCREKGKNSPAGDRFHFRLHNHRRDVGSSYSRSGVRKPAPWFSPKDISLKRKQMKKMLLYMKNVVDWKSDEHVQTLNLLFLKSHNMECTRTKVEDTST
ncbi:hypothetical protein AK88_05228 [Plasmodium fragile]|uniref:Ubiquitin-like protease family profile domain-containing protein n=1 Tax=Plasmodium fragile TaxID=5857 RepID=A0A0D9QDV7_PLAFR|nr:uncharacterized protein AK88_05228 [Plasmodium fragile]KJP85144.1 hypothetical protein AK88_05228 [Plasmodium fragile]